MFSYRFLRQITFVLLMPCLAGASLAQNQPPPHDVPGARAATTAVPPAASGTLASITARETAEANGNDTAGDNIPSNPLNDLVRILAGLRVSEQSRYADLMDSAAWQNYHQRIQQTWQRYDTQQHEKVEAFRDQWLPPETHQGRDLLYPFAGADFLYADLFFPQATNIYMFGLEPLGEIPGRERLNSAYYNGVIRSTEDLLRLTFFRTKAMREDFRHNGTVPLLSYFIVHRGHSIQDITYLRLDETGMPYQAQPQDASGARIAFYDARSSRMRYIWYWRGDLSNQGLASTPGLAAYITGLPPSNLYMKAASYLCHHQGFENACTLFRDRALLSLQEDSGMPLRFFPEEDWNQTFFGQYRDPISVFTDGLYRQNNALRNAFATADRVHDLPFPLGYHASARADNLMLAVRRDQANEATPDSAPAKERVPEQEVAPQITDQAPAATPRPADTQEAPALPSPEQPPVAAAAPKPTTIPAPEPTVAATPPKPSQETRPEIQPVVANAPHQDKAVNLQQQLDAAGITYKINESGTIWLIQPVDNSRTQLTFLAPDPKPVGGLAMRDIWSVGYLSEDDALSVDTTTQLLKDNAATDEGAWELGRFLGKAAGIFRTRIPADADWQTISQTLRIVATTADRKERVLMGNDNL
ncbi:hypothetical protein [Thiorhodovibrio frisius]|uniref:hypothetical protein n=1 Tax=Thiorhodovibrio frisius TaxID=631362 RepID=UPI00117E990B|nr:hypothetical protein [Thiorhodovibrio frisius]